MTNTENLQLETDVHEGITGGICYTDAAGVNLQVCFQWSWFLLIFGILISN